MARVGILGGSFNPPHIGHLLCAQEAHSQLGLDRVLLIPVASPPHKELDRDPGADVRLELCRLAAREDERIEVSAMEVDRGGPSYTVDTLRAIHAEHPEDDLTFIAGGDMAASLPTWREPREILSLARMAVAERRGVKRVDVLERVASLGAAAASRVEFFELPRVDVSSSDVRRRIAEGRPIRYLVPDAVVDAIETRGLYVTPAAAEVTL
jgi:nicotinate-nucleotide adenylyltransferase